MRHKWDLKPFDGQYKVVEKCLRCPARRVRTQQHADVIDGKGPCMGIDATRQQMKKALRKLKPTI